MQGAPAGRRLIRTACLWASVVGNKWVYDFQGVKSATNFLHNSHAKYNLGRMTHMPDPTIDAPE
jgi:hypothetical protein